ncbi:MAG TPA: hypothetical protein VHW00_14165 [Thermoanaerobaculia bacterium]|nr:hypothetical protein [Thermoanaerobaculia bacterium]
MALLFLVSLPLSASQFVEMPFDQVARESQYVVRAQVVDRWSAWDDAHEVIYTYATLRVNRYFGETAGPDTLVVREAGGTVDGYTMEAIGFPELRAGEDVVLFLSPWSDGSADLRIHAFNQGKLLVRQRGTLEVVVPDAVRQGDARLARNTPGRLDVRTDSVDDLSGALSLDELTQMIDDARAGKSLPVLTRE